MASGLAFRAAAMTGVAVIGTSAGALATGPPNVLVAEMTQTSGLIAEEVRKVIATARWGAAGTGAVMIGARETVVSAASAPQANVATTVLIAHAANGALHAAVQSGTGLSGMGGVRHQAARAMTGHSIADRGPSRLAAIKRRCAGRALARAGAATRARGKPGAMVVRTGVGRLTQGRASGAISAALVRVPKKARATGLTAVMDFDPKGGFRRPAEPAVEAVKAVHGAGSMRLIVERGRIGVGRSPLSSPSTDVLSGETGHGLKGEEIEAAPVMAIAPNGQRGLATDRGGRAPAASVRAGDQSNAAKPC